MLLLDKMKNKIFIDSVLAFAIKIIGASFGLLISIVIARKLGAEEAGTYYLSLSIFMYICSIGSLGFNFLTLRLIASASSNWGLINSVFNTVTLFSLTFCVLLSSLLYGQSYFIANEIFSKPEMVVLLKIFSLSIPSYVLLLLHSHAIQGVGNTHSAMIISGPLINVIFLAYILFFEMTNTEDLVIGNSLSYLFCFICGVLLWFNRKETKITSKLYSSKQIFKSSMPLLLTQVFAQINSLSAEIFIGYFSSSSQVALFSVSNKLATITAFVLIAVNRAVSANYAKLYSEGKLEELQYTVTVSARIMTFGGVLLIFVLLVFSEYLLGVFGEEFVSAKNILIVLLLAQFINVLTGSVSFLLSMTGHEKIQTKIVFMSSLSMVFCCFMFIPTYGAFGASLAVLFSLTLNNILGWYFVKRKVGVNTLRIF
ncbi:oligosaccharide flippase family protein [Vibrio splendidus]|uniref:oligosaccharide flippase family protein n=1 Tax=Vibrio splendidus TaxID=29497 RepID=UPI000D39EEF9|nr:oligosaccharide flippase family protein [Vibrio splendidus]PTP29387.1 hypothetical protein CWN92_11775 [Vibrio splendidus]